MNDYLNNPEVTFNPKLSMIENYNNFLKQVSKSFELMKCVLGKHKVLSGNLLIRAMEVGEELRLNIVFYDNWGLSSGDYQYEEYRVPAEVEETVKQFLRENYPRTYELIVK